MKRRLVKKNKKKRGFTLIELLAVILILGIIALIAIPMVNDVIDESKKSAAESSARQYVKSFEEYIVASNMMNSRIKDGTYTVEEIENMGLPAKGTFPDDGEVVVEKNKVKDCHLVFGDYNFECEKNNVVFTDKDFVPTKVKDENSNGEEENNNEEENVTKFVINQDNDSNNTISKGDKVCLESECFYVIEVNGDDVRMLSEWNLNVGYDISRQGRYEIALPMASITSAYNASYKAIMHNFDYVDIKKINETTIKQDPARAGYKYVTTNGYTHPTYRGVIPFVELNSSQYVAGKSLDDYEAYWSTDTNSVASKYVDSYNITNVFDTGSYLYSYVSSYVNYLKSISNISVIKGDLFTYSDVVNIGCSMKSHSCLTAPSWVYNTSYWTASTQDDFDSPNLLIVLSNGDISYAFFADSTLLGVRPVIKVSKSMIK